MKKDIQIEISSLEVFKEFINSSPSIITFIDNNGLCQYISANSLTFLNCKEKEIIGKKIPWIQKDDSELVYNMINKSIKDGVSFKNLEYRAEKKDKKFWVASSSWNPVIQNNIIVGLMMITSDITWQKFNSNQSDNEENNLNSIFHSTLDRIAVWDSEFNYLYANEAELRYHNKTKDQIISNNVDNIYVSNKKSLSNWKSIVKKVFETGYPEKFEDTSTNNKTKKIGEVLVSPIKDEMGNINSVVFVYRDITERKKQEEELQNLNKLLQQSNSELEQFAYIASHDLQEPLRAIAGYVQLLKKNFDSSLDSTANDYINRTVAAAERMSGLIRDILSFSKITTHAKDFSKVDLNLIIEKILLNLSVMITEKKAKITFNKLPNILADESQILLLFQNLIFNALKFNTKKDVNIKIYFEKDIKNKNWIFFIEDNGIGIDKKYFNKIFVLFQRLHTREEFSGSGIGLALCKKIVERHKGKIWLDSELGKGTIFQITLPFNIRRH